MEPENLPSRKAVAPIGGARHPWRALDIVVEKPVGTTDSTLVN
jgi:hypothetical protein